MIQRIILRSHYFVLTLTTFVLFSSYTAAQSQKFGRTLIEAMNRTDGPLSVLVVMEEVGTHINNGWGTPTPAEIEAQRRNRVGLAQEEVREFMNSMLSLNNGWGDADVKDYKPFWVSNAMMATMSQHIIWELAEFPQVKAIIYDKITRLDNPATEDMPVDYVGQSDFTYGLTKIGVPELRTEYPELTGEGVVVGILDTGIDANHPELAGKVSAWKDFIKSKDQPYDDNGHGTHVAGTISGEGVEGTQIGIAPRVKLVIGKVFSAGGSARLSGILRGMEWVANPEGDNLHTSLRPRVVNNSWGGSMESDIRKSPFTQAVVAWVDLGIFPAFAAGNAGPGSETVGSPGGLPMAYAVGATTDSDSAARFSSRGPVKIVNMNGERETLTKPDISAPGQQILSAWPGGGYNSISGTSMATPHLVGAVALLYQANPQLSIAQMSDVLRQSAQDLGREGKDNTFGEGRLNVYQAMTLLSGFF